MALSWLFRSTFKLGVCGGAVYYTAEQGIWADSSKSTEVVSKIRKILPGTDEYTKEIPSWSCVTGATRNYWNKGVEITFNAISSFPATANRYTKQGWEKVQELVQQPPQTK